MVDNNKAGYRIKKMREAKKETQAELAKVLMVKRETVNQWENGTRDLKTQYTIDLAKHFETTCDFILRGIKSENVSVHEKTGLLNEAIDVISNFDSEKQKTLSNIIENDKFREILSGINEIVNQQSLYNQFILEIIERVNKADESAMANISSTSVGYGDAFANARNVNMANDSKTVNAKEYIAVLRYRLKNIFEDIINEVTYSKDFDTGILDMFTQLFAADDNDPLYQLKIDTLKMVQNDEWKKFLREKMKNYGWSKA